MATEINNSNMTDTGYFQANITSETDSTPISGATVQILDINNPNNIIEQVTTDSSGQSEPVELPTPPLEYSMDPSASQPYAEYTIRITAPDFESVDISGAEILAGQTALQNTALIPQVRSNQDTTELYVIPPHTLYAEYPPKIPEDAIKEMDESGEVVLSRVVIPEYVIVHDGVPNDSSAKNYYVKYKDCIKHKILFSLFHGLSRPSLPATTPFSTPSFSYNS